MLVIERVEDSDYEYGADCTFIVVGGRGLKCYENRKVRDIHYRHQKRLSAIGLAPYCDDCVDVTLPGGHAAYAYWTGLAEIAHCRYAITWTDPQRVNDRTNLKDRLARAGYEWHDDHDGNWGYVNGRAVLIDCAGY